MYIQEPTDDPQTQIRLTGEHILPSLVKGRSITRQLPSKVKSHQLNLLPRQWPGLDAPLLFQNGPQILGLSEFSKHPAHTTMLADAVLEMHHRLSSTVFLGPPGTRQLPRAVRAFNHLSYRGWYTIDTFDKPISIGSDVVLSTVNHGHFVGQVQGIGYINPTDSTSDLELKGFWVDDQHRAILNIHLFVATSNLSPHLRSRTSFPR